jgi:hypothetical protein
MTVWEFPLFKIPFEKIPDWQKRHNRKFQIWLFGDSVVEESVTTNIMTLSCGIPGPPRTQVPRCGNTFAFATPKMLSNYTVQLRCVQCSPGCKVTEKSLLVHTSCWSRHDRVSNTGPAWAAHSRLTDCMRHPLRLFRDASFQIVFLSSPSAFLIIYFVA